VLLIREQLQDLRRYIDALDSEAELLALEIGSPPSGDAERLTIQLQRHAGRSANKRRFDYTSVIVSLYGFWEQYVESVVAGYVAALSGWLSDYDGFPERLVRQHLDGTIALLGRIQDGRGPGAVSTAEAVQNLHSCLSNAANFRVNREAMIFHSANVRRNVLDQLASGVGVVNLSQRVRDCDAMSPFMKKRFPEQKAGAVSVDETFGLLDELALRRNEASHGVPSDIISNPLLRDLIDAIESFAEGVYEVLNQEALPFKAASGHDLGQPVAVFSARVCGVRLANADIRVGDQVLMRTRSKRKPYREALIEELQVNNVSKDFVSAAQPLDVGVRLSDVVRRTYGLFLVPSGRNVITQRPRAGRVTPTS
jgi:hypothetical protein